MAAAWGSMPLLPPSIPVQKKRPRQLVPAGPLRVFADQSSSIGGASSLSFERGLV